MTAQPERHAEELIPRPERTITARKAALAVVASDHLLLEMRTEQSEAITKAIDSTTLDPLRGSSCDAPSWWSSNRYPGTASKLRRAEYLKQVADDTDDSRRHARAAAEIIRAVCRALHA